MQYLIWTASKSYGLLNARIIKFMLLGCFSEWICRFDYLHAWITGGEEENVAEFKWCFVPLLNPTVAYCLWNLSLACQAYPMSDNPIYHFSLKFYYFFFSSVTHVNAIYWVKLLKHTHTLGFKGKTPLKCVCSIWKSKKMYSCLLIVYSTVIEEPEDFLFSNKDQALLFFWE